jgi:hypothetical protein
MLAYLFWAERRYGTKVLYNNKAPGKKNCSGKLPLQHIHKYNFLFLLKQTIYQLLVEVF